MRRRLTTAKLRAPYAHVRHDQGPERLQRLRRNLERTHGRREPCTRNPVLVRSTFLQSMQQANIMITKPIQVLCVETRFGQVAKLLGARAQLCMSCAFRTGKLRQDRVDVGVSAIRISSSQIPPRTKRVLERFTKSSFILRFPVCQEVLVISQRATAFHRILPPLIIRSRLQQSLVSLLL